MSHTLASQRASQWLAGLEEALSTRTITAVPALFDDVCFWRDLVAFTWNIKTMEGKEAIAAMLGATLCRHAGRAAGASTGRRTRPTASPKRGSRSRRTLLRGSGYLRLKGDKCWTLLTAASALKGHEEKAGAARELGRRHGVHRNRKTWLERKTEEEAELGTTRQPYCVIIGGGQGGIALARG